MLSFKLHELGVPFDLCKLEGYKRNCSSKKMPELAYTCLLILAATNIDVHVEQPKSHQPPQGQGLAEMAVYSS